MKKTLISALTTALVIGAASTTFAAANPFEDVPADHWAYDAIAQLAADGVIEGYGDGTYRGDQEITRYEMAQMVARAMAKGGGDKALIDKLAAEFADELNNLGVRVAALEKKVDNVKWLGTVRYRYINTRQHQAAPDIQTNAQYLTLRLEPEMQINKNWTGHARIDYNSDMNSAANTTGNAADIETGGIRVERMWVQGDYKNFQILLGRLPYVSFIDNGMFFDQNISGGQITVGSKIKGTVTVGRYNFEPDTPVAQYTADNGYGPTGSYAGVEIYNDREDKITWGIGFHYLRHTKYYNVMYNDTGKKSANVWDIGLGWQIDDNFNLNGAYAWNSSTDESSIPGPGNDSKHAWTVELDYKGADPEDAGSWGAFVAYRKLGWQAALAPTYDAIGAGQKGVEMGFDIVPMKNFQATFKYFIGNDMGVQAPLDDKASTFFTELNFFF